MPKWSAKLCTTWGEKIWKVFCGKTWRGQISYLAAQFPEEAIALTKKHLAVTKRKSVTIDRQYVHLKDDPKELSDTLDKVWKRYIGK